MAFIQQSAGRIMRALFGVNFVELGFACEALPGIRHGIIIKSGEANPLSANSRCA
jgi:hypothetical protein